MYTFEIESRITNIDLPGTTADPSYTYNGLDTRVGQVISGNTSSWKRSGFYVTESVLNEGSTAFTPGVSSRNGSTSTFTHAGLKNTDRQSQSATMSATRQYDAFGNQLTSTGTWTTRFGYAGNFGYQGDDDTGLKLLGHRYYDSSTGRFLTRDPIKDGRNWYGYGGGTRNPLDTVDPDGLMPWLVKQAGKAIVDALIEYILGKLIAELEGKGLSAQQIGTAVHKQIADAARGFVKRMGWEFIVVEGSFKDGSRSRHGGPGSVRPDIVIEVGGVPWYILDWKKGKNGTTKRERDKWAKEVFGGRPGIIVEAGIGGTKFFGAGNNTTFRIPGL